MQGLLVNELATVKSIIWISRSIHLRRAIPKAVNLVDFPAIPFGGAAFGSFVFCGLPEFESFEDFWGGSLLVTGLSKRRSDALADKSCDRNNAVTRPFGKRNF